MNKILIAFLALVLLVPVLSDQTFAMHKQSIPKVTTIGILTPPEVICLGVPGSPDYCHHVQFLMNGTWIENPYNLSMVTIVDQIPYPYGQPTTQTQTEDEETGDRNNDNDDNDNNDSGRPPSNNPYCDVVAQTGEPYDACFDRKDFDQETGLYPCKDGSDVEDWRDCNGDSNNDNDDSGHDGDRNNDIKYCDGQAAPAYPDSCYDRNDLPEDSGYDDDDVEEIEDEEVFGEVTEGYEEDDGYIDDDGDGIDDDVEEAE